MSHLQVKFHTKQQRYKVGESPFSVLGSVSSSDLNEVIHKLLEEEERLDEDSDKSQVEFDFLVAGELLRSTLLEHIHDKGLSVESVLLVEYFEKENAPELELCLDHKDWMSGVQLDEDFILAGSYDCSVTVWDRKGDELVSSSVGHSEPVKDVAWIKHSKGDEKYFLSGSQDQNIILWKYEPSLLKVKCLFRCKGHSKSVECLSVNRSGTKFVSGSWDCSIKLWTTSPDLEPGTKEVEEVEKLSSRKRQKVEKKGYHRTPKMTLCGHTEAVSGVSWLSEHEICSGSWDHTIRTWDLRTGEELSCLRGSKAITSLDYSNLSRMVATGNVDRHIRLWDPRSEEGAVVKSSLTSHQGWVTSVRWSPLSPHLLVSGSLDNVVKTWDTRSPKTPLYDLTSHTDKVMCVDWSQSETIASGGADNKIFLFSSNSGNIEQKLE
ncbi:ribosome biogenesis protein wdr12-like [Clavelina lepadiformis]|uniref:ribosome biogenesis protein wdr12-like n=1 Tax=Clavelina lepadiformis TaxID=159417 RepID=UPI00404234CB